MTPIMVRAETPVYGGYVLGRDGKVLFIKGAIPGEFVEVNIKETRKDYSIGEVIRVIEPSEFRREPPCPYFMNCGGCQLQHIQYEKQIAIKEEILRETLLRIGGIRVEGITSLTDNEFHYRHRAQFKVSRDGAIGFYKEGTREVIPVKRCMIVVEPINDFIERLRGIDLRGVKELQVISGDVLTLLLRGNVKDDTIQAILDLGVSGIAFENGDSIGRDYISLEYEGLRYTITPWGFFQSHWSLNKRLVRMIVERLSPLEGKKVLDLYSGAGNFSLPIAVVATEVVAVEENHYAIEDGKRNAMINGIKNCLFVQSSVEGIFKDRKKEKLFKGKRYEITILDPPRPGLSSELCKRVIDLSSERIVYISCNPSTLARDLKKMKERYDIESLYMVDFFPNTYHIEAVVFLRLR